MEINKISDDRVEVTETTSETEDFSKASVQSTIDDLEEKLIKFNEILQAFDWNYTIYPVNIFIIIGYIFYQLINTKGFKYLHTHTL